MADDIGAPAAGGVIVLLALFCFYGVGKMANDFLGIGVTNIGTVSDPQKTPMPIVGTMREVNTTNLNMRSGPGSSYSVVATLPKGSRVMSYGETIKVNGEYWTQASTSDGQTRGWVNFKYLSR